MTNEDWHVLLRALRTDAGAAGLLYILTFYLVFNVCLLSLMTALTINTFLSAKEVRGDMPSRATPRLITRLATRPDRPIRSDRAPD